MPVKRNIDGNCTNVTCSTIILDIEGTTTSIHFVKDGLFPYVREHLEQYVSKKWTDEEFQEDLALLIEQSKEDTSNQLEGAIKIPEGKNDDTKNCLIKSVMWLMDNDRKVRALKQLQGHIWQEGYNAGELKGHVYDDVAENLKKWTEDGKKVYIYSSGSVQAQKLLFGHSEKGDLLSYISGHFDTEIGAKGDASSYCKILEELKCQPNEALFLTDVPKEASAANEAGIKALIVVRDGNAPLSEEDKAKYSAIKSFHEVIFCNPIKKLKMSVAALDIVETRSNLNNEISDHDEEVAVSLKNDNLDPLKNETKAVTNVENEVKRNTVEAVNDSRLNGCENLTVTGALKSEFIKQSLSDDATVEVIQTSETLKHENSEYIVDEAVTVRSKQTSVKGDIGEVAKEINSTETCALLSDHEIDASKNEERECLEDVEMTDISDKEDKSGKEMKVGAFTINENSLRCLKSGTENETLLSEPNENTSKHELMAEPIEDVKMAVITNEKVEEKDKIKQVKKDDDILKSVGNKVEIVARKPSEALEKDTSKHGVLEQIDYKEMSVISDKKKVGITIEEVKGNEKSSECMHDVKETDESHCIAEEEKVTEVPIEETQTKTAADLVDGSTKEVFTELPQTTTDSERGEVGRSDGKKEMKEMPPTSTDIEYGETDRSDVGKGIKEMPVTPTGNEPGETDRSDGDKEIKEMSLTSTDNEHGEIHRSDDDKVIKDMLPTAVVKMATETVDHPIDKEELQESMCKKPEAENSVHANGETDMIELNMEKGSDKQSIGVGDGDRAALNGADLQLVETKKKTIGGAGDVLNDEEITEV